ncbi:aminopeptidase N [Aliikangiella maris]|uniref:Aminopeptidase N n=2 Tax=Aliikangiella maris TaxID=3162458 RepID=A0ABV2BX23_9GAMM
MQIIINFNFAWQKLKNLYRNLQPVAILMFSVLIVGCHAVERTAPLQKAPEIIEREPTASLSNRYAVLRHSQLSNVEYRLSLLLDAENDFFKGTVTIDMDVAANNRAPITIDFDGGEVSAVMVNNKKVEWQYNQWFISLAANLFRNSENNTVVIEYRRPYSTDGYGLHRFQEPESGEIYLYSHFEPYKAHRLFPHFNQPNIRAHYQIDVVAPKHWSVITSVRETKIDSLANFNHWHFPRSENFSSYIFPLHAGPYQVWEDNSTHIPLRLFARKQLAKYIHVDEWFTPTKQLFAFFEKYFAIPYPFKKYDQVVSPDYNIGAMENVAAVTFNERYVSRSEKTRSQKQGLATIIAHEMAHMWFGNLVTMDWWNGLWLKESFATYMSYLAVNEATEYKESWDSFYANIKQWAYSSDQAATTHAIELPVESTDDAYTNFDGITYGKGASVLRQLPFYLGEDVFRQGVRNYLTKYSYQNTTLSDFMNELAKAAQTDLTQWQQQWLYKAGLNTIKADFQCLNGTISQLSLYQFAPAELPTLRSQRVQLALYQTQSNGIKLNQLIPVIYQGEKTRVVEAVGLPCPDAIHPNYDDWGYVKVELDQKTIATLKQHINHFPLDKTRLMLWQSLWDSVKDAKMSVYDFIDFAINNANSQDSISIINNFSEHLIYSAAYLNKLPTNSNKSLTYLKKIETYFWHQLKLAKPASDRQREALWHAIGVTQSESALHNLYDIYQGNIQLDGLTIDQDIRWALVKKFNQFLYKDYQEMFEQETNKDLSDKGMNQAIVAQVIRPEEKNKQYWLDILVNSPEKYKLATAKRIMNNLFPVSQHHLHQKFSQQILQQIPLLDKKVEQAYSRAFAGNLIPELCTSQSIKQLKKAEKNYQQLSPSVKKAIKAAHLNDKNCFKILQKLAG